MNSISNFFTPPQMPDWFQKFQQFRQNPIGAIMSMRGINIPQNFNGTPQDLVNYLLSTGQMTQDQFQRFQQMASVFQSKWQ